MRRARRELLLATALLAVASPIFGQRVDRPARIGTLDEAHEGSRSHLWAFFHGRMRELGYVQGRAYVIEARWANGDRSKLNSLAADLVARKPDLLVVAGTPSALAAKRATRTIPIVFTGVAEPVKSGIVSSLGRPDANLTGVTNIGTQVAGQWLALLREVAPATKSVAFFTDTANTASMLIYRELQAQGSSQGMVVKAFDGSSRESVDNAFAAIGKESVDGVITSAAGTMQRQRRQIAEATARLRIPAVSALEQFAEDGGLMAYSADPLPLWARVGDIVDRILKGTKPGEIPVEQAATFRLVVNLGSAKAQGIKVPQSVVMRADKLID